MTTESTLSRAANTSVPILGVLADRWSPRSYDTTAEVDEDTLTAVLEAARWSPSAYNAQPWRFIVARRGTDTFEKVFSNLIGFNQGWAGNAAVLIVAIAVTKDDEGRDAPTAEYDLGQAIAHLSVQAHHEGLHVHQMSGIVADGLSTTFALPENLKPVTVIALGSIDAPDALADDYLRQSEVTPRERMPLSDIIITNN